MKPLFFRASAARSTSAGVPFTFLRIKSKRLPDKPPKWRGCCTYLKSPTLAPFNLLFCWAILKGCTCTDENVYLFALVPEHHSRCCPSGENKSVASRLSKKHRIEDKQAQGLSDIFPKKCLWQHLQGANSCLYLYTALDALTHTGSYEWRKTCLSDCHILHCGGTSVFCACDSESWWRHVKQSAQERQNRLQQEVFV